VYVPKFGQHPVLEFVYDKGNVPKPFVLPAFLKVPNN
jgi:hypothetical protein